MERERSVLELVDGSPISLNKSDDSYIVPGGGKSERGMIE